MRETKPLRDLYEAAGNLAGGESLCVSREAIREVADSIDEAVALGYVELPKGSDGKALRPGETVWNRSKERFRVVGVTPQRVCVERGGRIHSQLGSAFTHECPNTARAIAGEMMEEVESDARAGEHDLATSDPCSWAYKVRCWAERLRDEG